jgi:SPP1 gp7 family putative phage head morphogenesis protein
VPAEEVFAKARKNPAYLRAYDELEAAEREFAFTVANVSQAEIIADVYEAIERAVRDGTSFETFAEEVTPQLEESWGGEEPGRVSTIFRTNVMTSYNQGRYRMMTAPAVKEARPYWRWDVVNDARTSDDICRPIGAANVVLPQDHAWARKHYPPLHPNCRTVCTPLTEDEARAEGITRSPPNVTPVEGFGAAPSITGSDWEPDPADYPEEIGAELEDKLDETG